MIKMLTNKYLDGAKKGTILQLSPDSIVLYTIETPQSILK